MINYILVLMGSALFVYGVIRLTRFIFELNELERRLKSLIENENADKYFEISEKLDILNESFFHLYESLEKRTTAIEIDIAKIENKN